MNYKYTYSGEIYKGKNKIHVYFVLNVELISKPSARFNKKMYVRKNLL